MRREIASKTTNHERGVPELAGDVERRTAARTLNCCFGAVFVFLAARLPRRLHPPSPLPNSVRHIVATRLSFAPLSSDAALTFTLSTLHSFCPVHKTTFQRSPAAATLLTAARPP
jgi:hypothetical protein